jgi:hypothetical protein
MSKLGEDVSTRESYINRRMPTIIRHSQDGNLSDRAISALYTPGTLVNRGQIRIHVTYGQVKKR